MAILAEPDLIVNDDGSVYHLAMKPEALVAYSEGITAGRLLEVVQSMIQRIL